MTLKPVRLARKGMPTSLSHRSIQMANVERSGSYPALGASTSIAGTGSPSGILSPSPCCSMKLPSSLTRGSVSHVNPASLSSSTALPTRSWRFSPLPMSGTSALYQAPLPSGTIVYMGIATPCSTVSTRNSLSIRVATACRNALLSMGALRKLKPR